MLYNNMKNTTTDQRVTVTRLQDITIENTTTDQRVTVTRLQDQMKNTTTVNVLLQHGYKI